jgi:TolB protein
MTVRFAALAPVLLLAAPAQAQVVPPPAVEDTGLQVTVTDESAWEDLSLAIPSFATDRDQPTPANNQGTGALALETQHHIRHVVQYYF